MPNTMTETTPLLVFIRAMSKTQREAFAVEVGTTSVYLYQLAAQPSPNPRLQLALAITKASRRIAHKVGAKPLTLEDLLVGTEMPPQSSCGSPQPDSPD